MEIVSVALSSSNCSVMADESGSNQHAHHNEAQLTTTGLPRRTPDIDVTVPPSSKAVDQAMRSWLLIRSSFLVHGRGRLTRTNSGFRGGGTVLPIYPPISRLASQGTCFGGYCRLSDTCPACHGKTNSVIDGGVLQAPNAPSTVVYRKYRNQSKPASSAAIRQDPGGPGYPYLLRLGAYVHSQAQPIDRCKYPEPLQREALLPHRHSTSGEGFVAAVGSGMLMNTSDDL